MVKYKPKTTQPTSMYRSLDTDRLGSSIPDGCRRLGLRTWRWKRSRSTIATLVSGVPVNQSKAHEETSRAPGLPRFIRRAVQLPKPADIRGRGDQPPAISGIDLQFVDAAVRAQDDFYAHVDGKWLQATAIGG